MRMEEEAAEMEAATVTASEIREKEKGLLEEAKTMAKDAAKAERPDASPSATKNIKGGRGAWAAAAKQASGKPKLGVSSQGRLSKDWKGLLTQASEEAAFKKASAAFGGTGASMDADAQRVRRRQAARMGGRAQKRVRSRGRACAGRLTPTPE